MMMILLFSLAKRKLATHNRNFSIAKTTVKTSGVPNIATSSFIAPKTLEN
jgi:hypothetical protein